MNTSACSKLPRTLAVLAALALLTACGSDDNSLDQTLEDTIDDVELADAPETTEPEPEEPQTEAPATEEAATEEPVEDEPTQEPEPAQEEEPSDDPEPEEEPEPDPEPEPEPVETETPEPAEDELTEPAGDDPQAEGDDGQGDDPSDGGGAQEDPAEEPADEPAENDGEDEPAAGARAESEAGHWIEVSQVDDLDPDGQTVTVTGGGFPEDKGIYVALCVEPEPGEQPTPCLGGVDMTGEAGNSMWISSNPPPYGESLAVPYDEGGSFQVEVAVTQADQFTDCNDDPCAVVTRTDHTRTSDRSLDLIVPVTWAD